MPALRALDNRAFSIRGFLHVPAVTHFFCQVSPPFGFLQQLQHILNIGVPAEIPASKLRPTAFTCQIDQTCVHV
jgi:hypothetical protein